MRPRLTSGFLGVAIVALSVASAHAFTMEGGSGNSAGASSGGANNFTVPKWDLEEQSRQFQSNGSGLSSTAGKNQFTTPFGAGTLEFGVRQNNFSSPLSPTFGGSSTDATRQQFDRMLAPPGLQHLYDQ